MLISELFTILPKSKHSASYGKSAGKYPFFTSSNTVDSFVDEPDFDGEYLIIGDGGTGNSKYINGKFSVSDHNYVLKPRNNTNPRAVNYFLKKDGYRILNEGFKGIGIKNVSKSYIESIDYRFNSKFAESQIVANLDKINNAIGLEKHILFELDNLIKSRFNEMFGDPIQNEKGFRKEKLSVIAPFNKIKNQIVKNNNTWLLNLDAIESNTGIVIKKERTSKLDGSIIEFDKSCVLYSKLRPYLNKVVVPDEEGFATSEMIAMKCGDNIRRTFLAYVLRHKSFVEFINATSGGTKMPRANMDALKDFLLILPPVALQNEFASFINQIDKLKFINKRQIWIETILITRFFLKKNKKFFVRQKVYCDIKSF